MGATDQLCETWDHEKDGLAAIFKQSCNNCAPLDLTGDRYGVLPRIEVLGNANDITSISMSDGDKAQVIAGGSAGNSGDADDFLLPPS